MKRTIAVPKHKTARGYTLIEVLIALLILLIGLLGVASTQLLSLQQVSNANLRSQVNHHAAEMVEMIRANNGQLVGADDEAHWLATLNRAVPGATADISTDDGFVDIEVSWTEREYGAEAAAQVFTFRARLSQ
ncbi:type IV pilus modification protein PilV [Marinobacter shengliensis]|uniref:type IV pilus modification protein PilV n=1 Tax=Marinobacter shengliensis TaxID=1389223 RepID=UPI000D102363|nr:type IV pilus modification protein PilV [Marinobacter shengliensis]PSF15472.1 type IV pilus modification protein PilV [Marinobacter shengliensis]